MADTSGTHASTGASGSTVTAATARRALAGEADLADIAAATGRSVDWFGDSAGCTRIGGTDCFLDDVRIAAPDGDVRVQDVMAGDILCVREQGVTMARPVVRVGSRTVHLEETACLDDHPVRIRAGAFAYNVPGRDLLVTADHCIHVDGRLIPVRLLVNGSTIIVDTGITSFTCHHLEFARHSVLIAEGLEVESHLDTGTRMAIPDGLHALPGDLAMDGGDRDWCVDAVAPLAMDRADVEPVRSRLAERAETLQPTARAAIGLIPEPAVRLVSDDGLAIEPILFDGSVYGFVVPGHVTHVRLASRVACPSEMAATLVDDRRVLGVRVGRIGMRQDRRHVVADVHLKTEELPGWHALDCPDGRWTDGNALLPIDASLSSGGPVFIDIEVLSSGPSLAGSAVTNAVLAA